MAFSYAQGRKASTRGERGVSILAAVFIIVVLSFTGLMFSGIVASKNTAALNDLQSAQALGLAEAGIQFVLKNGAYCTYAAAATNLGSGTFTVVSQYIGAGGIAPATVTDNPLDAVAMTVNVTSTANYAIPGTVMIDSEYLLCTAKAATQFTNCRRGWGGSTAAAHNNGAAVTQCVVTSTGLVAGSGLFSGTRRDVQVTVGP